MARVLDLAREGVDGDTVRLDGVTRGAVLINKIGADYRLRVTKAESGAFVIDETYPRGSELYGRLKRAFWLVREADSRALSSRWVHDVLRRTFNGQAKAA